MVCERPAIVLFLWEREVRCDYEIETERKPLSVDDTERQTHDMTGGGNDDDSDARPGRLPSSPWWWQQRHTSRQITMTTTATRVPRDCHHDYDYYDDSDTRFGILSQSSWWWQRQRRTSQQIVIIIVMIMAHYDNEKPITTFISGWGVSRQLTVARQLSRHVEASRPVWSALNVRIWKMCDDKWRRQDSLTRTEFDD